MTAITARPFSDSDQVVAGQAAPVDSLLRFAMRADATLCAGFGLIVAMAADPLSRLSGGNVAFAITVVTVLVAGWLPLTEVGVIMTLATTAVTLAFAYLQNLGVRRLA